jgi:hypothetical protein
MANSFLNDPSCVACWRFEPGNITIDTMGKNNLTSSTNAPTVNEISFKEGNGSAEFVNANTNYFLINEVNLSSDFPCKTGDTVKQMSICGWFNLTSEVNYNKIIGKWDYSGHKMSWAIRPQWPGLQLEFGTSNGASSYTTAAAWSPWVLGRWYHFGVTIDGIAKRTTTRIWDDTSRLVIVKEQVGSMTYPLYLFNSPLMIGAEVGPNNLLNAKLDEIVVFNRILSINNIDDIRQGNYTSTPSVIIENTGMDVIFYDKDVQISIEQFGLDVLYYQKYRVHPLSDVKKETSRNSRVNNCRSFPEFP